jgi:hypothetical protein
MIGRSFSELTDALILTGRFQQAIETARHGLAHLGGEVGALDCSHQQVAPKQPIPIVGRLTGKVKLRGEGCTPALT